MIEKRYLSEIYIYPIKSLPGVRLERAEVKQKGLAHDRRWMLIDDKGQFITLRKKRNLYTFHITQTAYGYSIGTTLHKSTIQIPFKLDEGEKVQASIWDDEVEVLEGNPGWSEWFSEVLDISCKLVFFSEESLRPIKDKWQVNNESVSLADGYPYLLIGQASLDDLNRKIPENLDISRFRPNLVFKGGKAYEEFCYKDFSIGEVNFKGLKPCARCVVTTIDPESLEADKEPLQTLSKQKVNDKVVFGQHVLALTEGEIKVGDEITVLSKKESPYDPL